MWPAGDAGSPRSPPCYASGVPTIYYFCALACSVLLDPARLSRRLLMPAKGQDQRKFMHGT